MIKIAVAGIGYVGLSNAVLLAQHNHVVAFDIVPERVAMLNDTDIQTFLAEKPLHLRATLHKQEAYADAEFRAS